HDALPISHRREEREIDGLLPGGVIEVVETAGRGTAGVDDEDVEGMERAQGVLNEHLTALPRREVSRDRQDVLVPSLPLDLLSHSRDRSLFTAAHCDLCALSREFLGYRATESLRRRCDEGNFAGQSEVHRR